MERVVEAAQSLDVVCAVVEDDATDEADAWSRKPSGKWQHVGRLRGLMSFGVCDEHGVWVALGDEDEGVSVVFGCDCGCEP